MGTPFIQGGPKRFRAKTPLDAFEHWVNRTETCWLWTGRTNLVYGQIWDGRHMGAHVWSYLHFVGPIPAGMKIDHVCNTPLCVNPEHLRPLTNGENIRRANDETCRSGHSRAEFTYEGKNGTRVCRACRRLVEARRR